MAAKQSRFEEQPIGQTFTDAPVQPAVEDPNPAADATVSAAPAPDPTPGMAETPQAANFFLSCLTEAEKQSFLDWCMMRGLLPEAGILAFMKEKIQRAEMNSGVHNPFVDEAQAVVQSVQHQGGMPNSYQFGRKPTKPCDVCGEPHVVEFPGQMLCKKPTCWHAYAGLTPQQPTNAGVRVDVDAQRRLGRLETMMERVAATLDRLVGAA